MSSVCWQPASLVDPRHHSFGPLFTACRKRPFDSLCSRELESDIAVSRCSAGFKRADPTFKGWLDQTKRVTASTESSRQDRYDNTNICRFRGHVSKKHNQNVSIKYEANTERGQIKNTQICEPSM